MTTNKEKERKRDDVVIRGMSPIAENGLESNILYYARNFYKKYLFPEEFGPQPLDMWYGNLHYGRVDEKYNPIFLSEENLKPVPSSSDRAIFLVDFVADAYKDMLEYWEEAKISGLLCEDSLFYNLDAKSGWENLKNFYSTWLGIQYDFFAAFYSPAKPVSTSVKNFDTFISEYINTMKTNAAPIATHGKFIFSSLVPSNISGLVIDFDNQAHDDDTVKAEFINDKLFTFFRDAAGRHGFLVDKNAPWRLIADIKSTKMREYMDLYGVAPETLFSYYYHKSYNMDLDFLKTHLAQCYMSYVKAYPVFKETKVVDGRVMSVGTERTPLTENDINNKYDLNFWLEKYIMIRNVEENNKFPRKKLNMIIRKAKNLNKHFDIYRALEYTNNNFKLSSKYSKSNKSLY